MVSCPNGTIPSVSGSPGEADAITQGRTGEGGVSKAERKDTPAIVHAGLHTGHLPLHRAVVRGPAECGSVCGGGHEEAGAAQRSCGKIGPVTALPVSAQRSRGELRHLSSVIHCVPFSLVDVLPAFSQDSPHSFFRSKERRPHLPH